MMFWYGDGMNGWGHAAMAVSMVLFWGLVIAGVVVLVRYLGRDTQSPLSSPPHRHTPEQVLAERFARGDIDEDEYRRRCELLRSGG